ncbi:dTDP-glucose 4,6-dehydratase [Clostridium botulinum]|uniref:dTDP-glucose 4,6-dehydratase n=4 Tax=Clostridium botulinum TaxID=1491 RepID=A5I5F8_CLOBH|nr:GDP-mannose 4,6-dehydratase [Clostridium botulinum]ABS35011.1 NAD-dependent epimerase/dehydratase family protein [Clostridium botulinum A str. ATCC 19397]ABS37424.1 NAD-dependent epimerase/dehydratase family protein [Clostridium botulinum A str. Hall]ACO86334.1 NAD-dependent epimerase/dehydratase family protein [Clostridium botulinum A2 str. Kyoto]APH23428.1 3-beta hydroxysteroid dehydrogenase/isomerase family protein [Clostridium botulinum]APQ67917.1 3-beta hydroxysteroid dehydrogenase/iso
MNILVTGGAGFIGRWVVKTLLLEGHEVVALDNLSNGRLENIYEFVYEDKLDYIKNNKENISGLEGENFKFIKGDIRDEALLDELFKKNKFHIVYHLGASINVQESIDDPKTTFYNDTIGTFNILEKCKTQMFGKKAKMEGDKWILDKNEKAYPCKVVFMSTCMVYDKAPEVGIDEEHRVKPISPYGGAKIAAENMVLSYYNAYKLPTVVIRPFNTYGPFQKTNGEGGVVAIFINNYLQNKNLNIYGTGDQTRDLLYVKDCANFVVEAGYKDSVNGQIVNAGTGRDITINELAQIISSGKVKINHVPHIHPQSEIMKLKCNYKKAKELMGWEPNYTLEGGIEETKQWIKNHKNLI